MKSFRISTVMIGVTIALSLATFCSSQFLNSSAHGSVADQSCLKKLEKQASGKKTGAIALSQFFFIVGKPVRATSITKTLREYNAGLNSDYWQLRRRINSLQGVSTNTSENLDKVVTKSTIEQRNKYMADTVAFGVEVLRVRQPDGRTKFLAIRPEIIGSVNTFDSADSRIPQRKQHIYSRSDFVNPQDIDWFFGVKDFSTYTHQ